MKTTEIVGFKRSGLGTTDSKKLRADGNVPCVVYGGKGEPIHFHSPMYLFKELVYTPNAYIVNLNIEGTLVDCILKDIQFHPVSDMILHADFFAIEDDKKVQIDVPVKITGTSPGVANGGKLFVKMSKLTVKAIPANLPDFVEVSIQGLKLGNSVRVRNIKEQGFEIVNNPQVTVASVVVTRALKSGGLPEDEDEEETEEAAEE